MAFPSVHVHSYPRAVNLSDTTEAVLVKGKSVVRRGLTEPCLPTLFPYNMLLLPNLSILIHVPNMSLKILPLF